MRCFLAVIFRNLSTVTEVVSLLLVGRTAPPLQQVVVMMRQPRRSCKIVIAISMVEIRSSSSRCTALMKEKSKIRAFIIHTLAPPYLGEVHPRVMTLVSIHY